MFRRLLARAASAVLEWATSPGQCRYKYIDGERVCTCPRSGQYCGGGTLLCKKHNAMRAAAHAAYHLADGNELEELKLRQAYSWTYGYYHMDRGHWQWSMRLLEAAVDQKASEKYPFEAGRVYGTMVGEEDAVDNEMRFACKTMWITNAEQYAIIGKYDLAMCAAQQPSADCIAFQNAASAWRVAQLRANVESAVVATIGQVICSYSEQEIDSFKQRSPYV